MCAEAQGAPPSSRSFTRNCASHPDTICSWKNPVTGRGATAGAPPVYPSPVPAPPLAFGGVASVTGAKGHWYRSRSRVPMGGTRERERECEKESSSVASWAGAGGGRSCPGSGVPSLWREARSVDCVPKVQRRKTKSGRNQEHSTVQYNSVQHSTGQRMQYSTVQYIQYSKAQHSAVHCKTAQYCTVEHMIVLVQ